MYNKIEVIQKEQNDQMLTALEKSLKVKPKKISTTQVYYISGLTKTELKNNSELFYDPITEEVIIDTEKKQNATIVEVTTLPGVMDPIAISAQNALKDSGIKKEVQIKTAKRYILEGISDLQARRVAQFVSNENVHQYRIGDGKLDLLEQEIIPELDPTIETINLNVDDKKLQKISKDKNLSLSLEELKTIQKYFNKIDRDPTEAEIETIAQTWSEHCKHKTFNSEISYKENGKNHHYENLFKETIVKATNEIAKKKKWLVSVFTDNAGIIKFDDKNSIAFKVETHNHPSALDPYGGAGTGIGGVIRDVLGAGLGATPIFNTDVFCFASPTYDKEIPKGIIHPKRILNGVVSGVRDYGNRMGIPTINGSITFDPDYLGAPLVFCGTAGIIPKGMEKKKVSTNDLIVLVGGKTGRDGIHGATFSSTELGEEIKTSVVQIGNAIEEKKVLDALTQARDQKLYSFITDCGAGGLSSAIGESAENTGCSVNLEKVPLKYSGLKPWEIWVSESQERMVVAVPKKNLKKFMEICKREEVEASVIGTYNKDKKMKVFYKNKTVIDMDMKFVHDGIPKTKREAEWNDKKIHEPKIEEKENYNEELLKIIAHPTIASKEVVIRQYDHEVQGNSVLKPLTGIQNDGPSDASAIRPTNSNKAVLVSNGINPRYSKIDSYWMVASAIDEALRNIVASGGNIEHTAILDNFCWGNTDEKEKLGSLVRASKACYDMATKFETPFISGKDSMHNEFVVKDTKISIPDTLLISAISVIEDANKIVTTDLKFAGNNIYIIGKTYDELGGSYFYEQQDLIGKNVPKVDPKTSLKSMKALGEAIKKDLIESSHDISEGGIAVALSEMAIAGDLGVKIDIEKIPTETKKTFLTIFSESNSRFLVEVKPENSEAFEKIMKNVEHANIGITIGSGRVQIGKAIDLTIDQVRIAWKGGLEYD